MTDSFRNALDQMPSEPISPDHVLLALGFLGDLAELRVIAAILGEDSHCPTAISRVSMAVLQLERDQKVERSSANPRLVQMTGRGRRVELQLREVLIRKNYREKPASGEFRAAA